jgi:hypothetical protein
LLKAEHTVSFLSKFENPTAIFRARNRSNGIKPALKESGYAKDSEIISGKAHGRTLGTPCKSKSLNQIIDHMDVHLDKIKEYNSVKRT